MPLSDRSSPVRCLEEINLGYRLVAIPHDTPPFEWQYFNERD
jgi:hypothetical protein